MLVSRSSLSLQECPEYLKPLSAKMLVRYTYSPTIRSYQPISLLLFDLDFLHLPLFLRLWLLLGAFTDLDVLLFPEPFLVLHFPSFFSVHEVFRKVAMPGNPPNFAAVLELLNKFLAILYGSFLPFWKSTYRPGSLRLPNANVHILGSCINGNFLPERI